MQQWQEPAPGAHVGPGTGYRTSKLQRHLSGPPGQQPAVQSRTRRPVGHKQPAISVIIALIHQAQPSHGCNAVSPRSSVSRLRQPLKPRWAWVHCSSRSGNEQAHKLSLSVLPHLQLIGRLGRRCVCAVGPQITLASIAAAIAGSVKAGSLVTHTTKSSAAAGKRIVLTLQTDAILVGDSR